MVSVRISDVQRSIDIQDSVPDEEGRLGEVDASNSSNGGHGLDSMTWGDVAMIAARNVDDSGILSGFLARTGCLGRAHQ